jgi:hypothetical protein
MRNKINFFFVFILIASICPVIAESSSSKFRHPLQIQAVGLYSKIQVQASAADKRLEDVYTRNQNAMVEGEWKALDNVSFLLTTGLTNFSRSDSGSFKGRDRIGFGIKSAWENENWLIGGGAVVYNRNGAQPKSEIYSPDLYILRSYFGVGFKAGDFQVQSDFQFQSETNSQFKEKFNEEFHRHFQAGVSLSYGVFENLAVFAEVETRIPYNKEIDKESRYASVYPGISIPTESYGTFAISAGIPIMNDRIYDRSVRLNYFLIF